MSSFEFVFSLLVILLGLALAEVLGGLARVVKKRPRVRLGWATALLATWTTTETVLFWRMVWRTRDTMPDKSAALFAGFIVTALCYFAAALVFPDEFHKQTNLDGYFEQEKGKVIGALIAANTLTYALRPAVMGTGSWSYMEWWGWVSLGMMYLAALAAIFTRRRNVAIGCLAVLVALDLLDPVESILSPN
jgi:hypothetical protein